MMFTTIVLAHDVMPPLDTMPKDSVKLSVDGLHALIAKRFKADVKGARLNKTMRYLKGVSACLDKDWKNPVSIDVSKITPAERRWVKMMIAHYHGVKPTVVEDDDGCITINSSGYAG